MKSKTNLMIFAWILLLTFLSVVPTVFAESTSYPQKVTFLYLNDFHGALEPAEKQPDTQHSKPYTVYGIARLAAQVKEIKEDNSKKHSETIFVSSGDFLQGTLLSNHFEGAMEVELFSRIGLTYYSLGNHELDFGADALKKMIDTMSAKNIPCVTSNLYINETPAGKPVIKDMNGVKIGLAGLVAQEDFSLDKPVVDPAFLKGIRVEPEYETAQKTVDNLKKSGVNFIVFLTHIGVELDKKLAKKVKGIDLIIGAHSHTAIETYEQVNQTYIVQAGCDCQYLGKIDITFVDSDSFKVDNARLIPLDEKITPDPEVNDFIEAKKAEMDGIFGQTIAVNNCFLDGEKNSIRYKETNLGDFVTDVLREYFHADIAVYNSGGIRHSIDKGKVTYAHIHQSVPFSTNQTMSVKVYGRELKEMLQWNAKQFGEGGFLQVSGLSFDVVPGKEVKNILVNRKLLEEDKLYTLVTNSFIVKGGDGYAMLAKIPEDRLCCQTNPTQIVIDYIKAHYGDMDTPISYCQPANRIGIMK